MKTQKPSHHKNVMARRFESKALHLAQMVCLCIGSPFALSQLSHLLNGRYLDCASASVDPSNYSSPDKFRDDYLVASLVKKADWLEFGVDREALALQGFLSCEAGCAATGNRLKLRYVNGLYSRLTPESILWMARGKISHLLGPFSWDLAEPLFRFGPGATVSEPHRHGDAYYKMRGKPSTTLGCATLAYTAVRRIPGWYNHLVSLTGLDPDDFERLPVCDKLTTLFEIVPGNRVTFVPKDALKCRTIAIEPTMNGFVQHGIGSMLRRRFRRVSLGDEAGTRLDLNDQGLNQRLAREGSVDGSLATLDLSAASDSVSWELVEYLFPPDWVEAFALTRSPRGILPNGELITYQKVSSMGNGFTFELESILFWALARSVVDLLGLSERRVAVYGDDIIVPAAAAHTLGWILGHCGFSLNRSKSFWTGEFRESCGKHYFRGVDVTPIFVRKDIDSVPRLIWYCNQIRRWSQMFWGLDGRLKPAYDLGVSFLPSRLAKPSIPDGVGDYALIGDLDEVCPRRWSSGVDAWSVKVWIPVVPSWQPTDVPFLLRQLQSHDRIVTDYRDALRSLQLMPWKRARFSTDPSGVPLLGKERWVSARMPVANWPSFGPWLEP